MQDRRTDHFSAAPDVIFDEAFRRFAIIGAAVAWTLALVWATQQHWLLSGLLFVFGLTELLLQRHARRIGTVLAATIATALPSVWIVGIVAVTGGPASSRGVWLLVPPLVAGLIFQSRYARRWIIAYGVAVLLLWVAEAQGYVFPDMIPGAGQGYAYIVSGLTAFLATAGLTLTYASAQQQALDSVGRAHAHLDLVLRSLPEGVLAVQRENGTTDRYRALYGNPVMDALLGGAITGLVLDDLTHERKTPFRKRLLEHLDRAARTAEPVQDRIDFGSAAARRSLQVHSQVLRPADMNVQIVSIVRDLTDQIDADRRLLQATRLASIGELVAGVAHELNNPLAAIMGTAELAADDATGVGREDLLRIRDNAERASRIVRSLLGFARETPPERVPVDLNDVVRNVIRLNLVPPDVRVETDLDEALPLTSADRTQLEQVVLNLLTNAEQAMREAGSPDPLIRVRTSVAGPTLLLQVADNGPGIPPDVMPRVFDPFFTTREFGQGTGLGLALSHGIVAGHGGAIRVESEPGAGSTFSIVLPIVTPERDAGARVRTPAQAGGEQEDRRLAAARPPRRVLIIDDEHAIRTVLARYLSRRGHATQQAESAEAALDLVNGSNWDAIVLDVRMPGLSGEGLYRKWRAERPDLAERVIFATGDTVTASTGGFLESTGQPVLEKPYDLARLAAIIEDVEFAAS